MAKPISPGALRNDVSLKLSDSDMRCFLILCKKTGISRGELGRLAIQRLIESELKTAPLSGLERRVA